MNLGELKKKLAEIENDEALVVCRDEMGAVHIPAEIFVENHEDTPTQTVWVDMVDY